MTENPNNNRLTYEARRSSATLGSAVPWRLILGVGVVVVVIVLGVRALFLAAGAASSFHSMVTDTQSLTSQQIESVGGFRFPRGAANVRSRYVSWLDFTLHVTFTIPPDGLDPLLDSTKIHRPLSSTQIPFSLSQGVGDTVWWTPGTPVNFDAGESHPGGQFGSMPSVADAEVLQRTRDQTTRPSRTQSILIDKTNPRLYTVWLTVSG